MAKKIVLYYKRLREEVQGEYPFQGRLTVVDAEDKETSSISFISCIFKDLIKKMHKELVVDEEIDLIWLQRTERDDLVPMELDSQSVDLLRKDPLTAYRNLMQEPQGNNYHTAYARIMGAKRKHEAEVFGENIYLDIARGHILNPFTGDWSTLAYGPAHGWKVREENNKPDSWLPIAMIDDAPKGTPFSMRLAFARWAVVSVHSLLARQADKYYLPRTWNKGPEGTWMSYKELKNMLTEHQQKEEECRQEHQKAE